MDNESNAQLSAYALKPGHALVLRCCSPDMTSANNFEWPDVGEVAEAPDWSSVAGCGSGLHGWLYGQGNHSCSDYWQREGAKWLVVEVEESRIVMLGGKCKFPRATVRFVGQKHEAAAFMVAHEARARNVAVIGHVAAVGDGEVAAVGALGTATAGDSGTICIQYWDAKAERYRVKVGYIGEDGLVPDTAYRLDEKHSFVVAKTAEAA